jgi:hypothetical protein
VVLLVTTLPLQEPDAWSPAMLVLLQQESTEPLEQALLQLAPSFATNTDSFTPSVACYGDSQPIASQNRPHFLLPPGVIPQLLESPRRALSRRLLANISGSLSYIASFAIGATSIVTGLLYSNDSDEQEEDSGADDESQHAGPRPQRQSNIEKIVRTQLQLRSPHSSSSARLGKRPLGSAIELASFWVSVICCTPGWNQSKHCLQLLNATMHVLYTPNVHRGHARR